MTQAELIAKQQLEIEEYKIQLNENRRIVDRITCQFFCIGAPLNDNILQFNKEQIKWAFETVELVNQIHFLKK